jgi:hypothetical protein
MVLYTKKPGEIAKDRLRVVIVQEGLILPCLMEQMKDEVVLAYQNTGDRSGRVIRLERYRPQEGLGSQHPVGLTEERHDLKR